MTEQPTYSTDVWIVYHYVPEAMSDVVGLIFPAGYDSAAAELAARRACEEWQQVALIHTGEYVSAGTTRYQSERRA